MGCKQSKAVKVQPVGATEMNGKLKKGHSENDAGIECDIDDRTKRHGKRSKSTKSGKSLNMGSCESLGDDCGSQDSDRGGSAGSKKSNDSGLGDLGEYNLGFITEHSDPDQVRQIESTFQEREGLELGITGTALPTRNSAKDKARLEESMILQKLREEGLISKPSAEKASGVSFEIFEMGSGNGGNGGQKLPSLPPIKLAKLEKRRKKKRSLTEEEIKQKLERAQERRKRKEQARLEKIKELDKADQTAALESFQDYQKKKEEQVIQKMDSVSDKRERRLQEIKEKQLERERRREEVRRRKKERLAEIDENGTGEIIKDLSELKIERQVTPMVPE